jgi:hypothetical protein
VLVVSVKVILARASRETLVRRADILSGRGRDEENKILNETKSHLERGKENKI